MSEPVRTVLRVDGARVHRFQVVRERPDDGGVEDWVVVGFDEDDDAVELAAPDFEWTRSVPAEAFRSGEFEPLLAGGVPVWGY